MDGYKLLKKIDMLREWLRKLEWSARAYPDTWHKDNAYTYVHAIRLEAEWLESECKAMLDLDGITQ